MTRVVDERAPGWRATLESLLLHVAIAALLMGGFWNFRSDPPAPQTMAIEAVVVDPRDIGAPPATMIAPPQSQLPPQPQTEPEKTVVEPVDDVRERRERARAEAKRNAEAKEKADAKAKAAAKAKADAKAKVDAKAKLEAEARAKAEAKAKDEARLREEAKLAAERRKRTELEADLQRQIAAEERVGNMRQSGLGVQWAAAIQARVQRAWIRPPSARTGLDCKVAVTQIPGGTVVAVKVLECNGDEVVRQSIEAAVYRASPLPAPPDPALFERNLELRFRPND